MCASCYQHRDSKLEHFTKGRIGPGWVFGESMWKETSIKILVFPGAL